MGTELDSTHAGGVPPKFDENIESSSVENLPPSNNQTPTVVNRALKDLTNSRLPSALPSIAKTPAPAQQAEVAHISEVAQEAGITPAREQISPFKALYSKSPPPTLKEIKATKGLSEPEAKALTYFAKELARKPLPDGIAPKTIIKVLKEYYANESLMENRGHGFMETKKGSFVVSIGDNHKFEILQKKEALGTGTFGHVSRMKDLFTDTVHALKQPRADLQGAELTKAKEDIQNEADIINFVHKGGVVPGVQAPGFSITGINKANADKTGMLGRAYEGSGNDIVGSMDTENQINRPYMLNNIAAHGAYQLLQGLEHLHDVGVVHGDIRPGNCLVNYKDWETESTTWVLGDLGGAAFTDQIDMAEAKKDPVGVLTASYLPREDQALAEKYSGHGANVGLEDKQKFIESKMKRDVFALGQTLCEMLAYAKPYAQDEANRPITTNGFNQSFIEWYFTEEENPEQLIAVLKGMCDPNPETRLSAKEAREQFAAWYTNSYPVLAVEFGIT